MPRRLRAALALADGRAESTFETLVRLLLVRAGLAPETLQLEVFDNNGRLYARLDMAWPSVKVGLEADGREFHDLPQALHRDRVRANQLAEDGWKIFRVTWDDLVRHPELPSNAGRVGGGEGGGGLGGGSAVAVALEGRVGVDLGDDVLAHEPDHLEGVSAWVAVPDAEDELVGAGRLPAPALREGVVGVADDDLPAASGASSMLGGGVGDAARASTGMPSGWGKVSW